MKRGLNFLALDLTHRCNLDCDFCGKMRWDSDFQLTMDQLIEFCDLCHELPAKFVRVSGGEPTTHPQFREMMETIWSRMNRPIELATNGIRLHEYSDLVPRFSRIHITDYGETNKKAIDEFGSRPNVNIITLRKKFDPYLDPKYTVRQGWQAYENCCRAQVNVCHGQVYGCCMAEVIERRLGEAINVHVDLRPGWIEDYKKKSCIEACRHCFIAAQEGWVEEPTKQKSYAKLGCGHNIIDTGQKLGGEIECPICHSKTVVMALESFTEDPSVVCIADY